MRRILWVEDDAEYRLAIMRLLEDAGFAVFATSSTMDGLDRLDAGLLPDLLLVDIFMPAGTPHGFAFARMARFKRPGLPVVFVTELPELATAEEDLPGPVLMKSCDAATLIETIEQQLTAAGNSGT